MKMVQDAGQCVAAYVRSLPDFTIHTQIDGNYGHLGAVLADAVLQANNNYDRNVRPRVDRIRLEFAPHTTLTALQALLTTVSAGEFLALKGARRQQTFMDLIELLTRERVDTELQFREWLLLETSKATLMAIRFIGPKTADYLKILVGLPTAAMDRHLFAFLESVGIYGSSYASGQEIVHHAADLMELDRAHLDHSIWRYMSSRAANRSKLSAETCPLG